VTQEKLKSYVLYLPELGKDGTFAIQKTIDGKRMWATARTIDQALAIREAMINGEYECEART